MIWTEFFWIVSVGYTESGFSEKFNEFSESLKYINSLTVKKKKSRSSSFHVFIFLFDLATSVQDVYLCVSSCMDPMCVPKMGELMKLEKVA